MTYNNVCKGLKFSDCELAIVRMAVDKAGEKIGRRVVNSEDIKKIIKTVEDFIQRKSLICYGGTAINNILPQSEQFYNKDVELPDYDFFSYNALDDAKELADIYFKQGFTDVEAKSGQHHGTYKVYVNFIPVADITYLAKEIYAAIKKESIQVAGIRYAPPNFLRMSMYLELSRPVGDTSRWEKVLKRLILLNKHYPLEAKNCDNISFQRGMENADKSEEIYNNVKNTFINQGVVFFGGFAMSMYSQYMPKKNKSKVSKLADFDVLSNDPETTSEIVKERLTDIGIKNVKITKRLPVGEIVPLHYEIKVGNDTIALVYKPIGCHSYNVIDIQKQKVKIATIDTMLSFYLAFLYTDRPYYNMFIDRILCMSQFLFDVQQKNRLSQKGLLKRFSITCYGHQETLEEMRAAKAAKYKELKQTKNSDEFNEWFLNYTPTNANGKIEVEKANQPNETPKTIKKKKPLKTKKNKFNRNTKTKKNMLKLIYGRNLKNKSTKW